MHRLLPLLFFPVIGVLVLTALNLFRITDRLERKRALSDRNLTRTPGHSRLRRLAQLNTEIYFNVICVVVVPMLMYAGYFGAVFFFDGTITRADIVATALIGPALMALNIFKLLKCLGERKRVRLSYAGKLAVARQLDQLMPDGYHVFHDLAGEKFNIDHVVVGPAGVFAVVTRTRPKSTTRARREDVTVTYDGRMLAFPNGDDVETIERADHQAARLSDWLSRAIGEPLAARAIVALPDWFVRRTSADGIPVVNPNQFPSLFAHIKPRYLSSAMIARITHQLDRQGRDV